ncbi:hypothetical protein BD626DRAFT_501023 [Schizophyllum amplum]|uniref:Uncharacterized protein n=1 Tax=Schizophyllum amplum TaxID=97359 RepID=A0A550C9H3_9AGAR|nr:hypothetical protein BD626DRAFT_501023 [Auriculariopsis ampla]
MLGYVVENIKPFNMTSLRHSFLQLAPPRTPSPFSRLGARHLPNRHVPWPVLNVVHAVASLCTADLIAGTDGRPYPCTSFPESTAGSGTLTSLPLALFHRKAPYCRCNTMRDAGSVKGVHRAQTGPSCGHDGRLRGPRKTLTTRDLPQAMPGRVGACRARRTPSISVAFRVFWTLICMQCVPASFLSHPSHSSPDGIFADLTFQLDFSLVLHRAVIVYHIHCVWACYCSLLLQYTNVSLVYVPCREPEYSLAGMIYSLPRDDL